MCLNLMQGLNISPSQDFCCMSSTFFKLMDAQGNLFKGNQMSCTLSDASVRQTEVQHDLMPWATYSAMVIPNSPVPTLEELCPQPIVEPLPTGAVGLSKLAAVAIAAASVLMTLY